MTCEPQEDNGSSGTFNAKCTEPSLMEKTLSLPEMLHYVYLQIYFCNTLLLMRRRRIMEAKCLQMELESGTLLGAQFPLWVELIIINV